MRNGLSNQSKESDSFDYNRYDKLLDSMERYSKKLESLIEKTAQIETTQIRKIK